MTVFNSLSRLVTGYTLPAALSLASAAGVGGCMLDRRPILTDGGAGGDGGMTVTDGGGGMGGDGGIGGEGGMGGGPLVMGSQFVPDALRPVEASTLPPVRAFFLWQNGDTPPGRTLEGYEFCRTTGPATAIDAADECPNSEVIAGLFHVLNPLTPETSYRWKIRARYDGGHYSEWSAVRVFSTDDSLIGWWSFNEGSGSTATDSSTLSHDGTLSGAPQWVAGISGQALRFNGSNNVLIGDDAGFEGMSGLSVEAWVRTSSNELNRAVVSKWYTGTSSYILRSGGTAVGTPSFSSYTTAAANADGPMSIADGAWRYWVGTYDGSMNRLFVDLMLQQQVAQTGTIADSEEELCIGDFCDGGAGQNLGIIGDVDEVAIYNRALSSDEQRNSFCATQAEGGVDPLPAACLP